VTDARRQDVERISYGEGPDQWLELLRPAGDGLWPVVVLIHGGFWRAEYDLTLMGPLAADLVPRGFVVANLEYRRVGQPGGGWPGTLDDVAAGIDALDGRDGLDLARLVTVGHSAGGHLAVWAAARPTLPTGAPGEDPRVRVVGAVSLAVVVDLLGAAAERLSGGATRDLLGGEPSAVPDRYALASPMELVPIGVPVALVHGTADANVPITQSEDYAEVATAAGDAVVLERIDGADHFAVIDPTTEAWAAAVRQIDRLAG
jgi:acetyl esterase/lipase